MKVYRFHILTCFLLALITTQAISQQTTFSKVFYDSVAGVYGYSIAKSIDGGFVIAGNTANEGLVLKVDSSGSLVWSKLIGSTGGESFNSVVSTIDSCFVAAGVISNLVNSTKDILCVKINTNGDTLWSREIDCTGDEKALSVQQTFDHGFIICGNYSGPIPANYGTVVVKLDSSGNLEWSNVYALGNFANYGYCIRQTPDSGYLIAGAYENNPPFEGNGYLLKLFPGGGIEWSKKYNLPVPAFCYIIHTTLSNDGILSLLNADANLLLMKTDFFGNYLWSKNLGFGGVSCLDCLNQKIYPAPGNSFLILNSQGFSPGWVFKVDSSGTMLWRQQPYLISSDLVVSNDSGLCILGNGPLIGVHLSTNTGPQFGIIKTDSLGNEMHCIYPDLVNSTPNDTVVSSTEVFSVINTGTIYQISPQVFTPSLEFDPGCVAIIGSVPENSFDNVFTIFPNPSHNEITISVYDPSESSQLFIYDIIGREIYSKMFFPGELENTLIPVKLNSGIYTVALKNKKGRFAKKLIVE
jgi:hypothetical protein